MKTVSKESPKWDDFFIQCLHSRIRAEELESLMTDLDDHYPIDGSSLADILLERQVSRIPDPLLILYFDKLLTSGRVNVDEALNALLKRFLEGNKGDGEHRNAYHLDNCAMPFEDVILNRIAITLANGTRPKTVHEARKIIHKLYKWISSMLTTETTETIFQAVTGGTHQPSFQSSQIRESLGMLIITALENSKLQVIIQDSLPKGKHFRRFCL